MSETEANTDLLSVPAPKLAEISIAAPDFTSMPTAITISTTNCAPTSSPSTLSSVASCAIVDKPSIPLASVDKPSVTFASVDKPTVPSVDKPTVPSVDKPMVPSVDKHPVNNGSASRDTAVADDTIVNSSKQLTTVTDNDIDVVDRPRRSKLSAPSATIVEKSRQLLNAQPSSIKVEAEVEMMMNRSTRTRSPDTRRLRDLYSPDDSASAYSTTRYDGLTGNSRISCFFSVRAPLHTRRFPRIDFDDVVDEALSDRRPAWQQLQESIKDSYHRANRAVDRSKQEAEFMDGLVNNDSAGRRRRAAADRDQSPFSHLDSESLSLRKPSWFASGAMEPRGLTASGGSHHRLHDTAGRGFFEFTALSHTKCGTHTPQNQMLVGKHKNDDCNNVEMCIADDAASVQ